MAARVPLTLSKPVSAGESPWRRAIGEFTASRSAMVAVAILVALVIAALFAPYVTPQNPYDLEQLDIVNAHLKPGARGAGGILFWLGTDDQGRDIFSAIVYGLRTSLMVGFVCTSVALAIGIVVGLLAAYLGGWFEMLVMRLVDLQLSFPAMLIALILLSLIGSGLDKAMIAIIAVQWAYYTRTIRSAALVECRKEYIEAARNLGLSNLRVVFNHLLPNSLPPVIVVATINVATAISVEATLSFLGLGAPITEPSLGRLIANGYNYMLSGEYWISFFPGLVLVLTIVSINLVGDQLRDVLNPRLKK